MNKQTVAMNTVRAIIKAEPTFSQGFVYTSRVIQAGHVAGLSQVTTREWLKLEAPKMGIEVLAMRDDPTFGISREAYRADYIKVREQIATRMVKAMKKENPQMSTTEMARRVVVNLEGAEFPRGTVGFQTIMKLVTKIRNTK